MMIVRTLMDKNQTAVRVFARGCENPRDLGLALEYLDEKFERFCDLGKDFEVVDMALGMLDGIAMKVARCGGLWNAAQIVTRLEDDGLAVFASGLTDPDWSLAASVHLFARAGLERPAALNGPQYVAGRGTNDPEFRAVGDAIRVPTTPGLGIVPDERAERTLQIVAGT